MKKLSFSLLLLILGFAACKDDDGGDPVLGEDLTNITFDPKAHTLTIPPGLPSMDIPADNPLTDEGIELGRRLFYDPILSKDSTISCSSCHQLKYSFNDISAFSPGVGGLLGNRSSMSLINIGFQSNGMFWDGRAHSIEEQALGPVENPLEMAELWKDVEVKLRRHPDYKKRFRQAFGIDNTMDITKELAVKAIAQFERTLISANSRYDKKKFQLDPNPFLLSDLEADGQKIYYDDQQGGPDDPKGHCAHCHDGNALFTSEVYRNNAITQVATLNDFPDKGLGAITGNLTDNGMFKSPSLRNVVLTAPYMHDGSIQTLEEVIEHYNSGGHYADNVITGSITQLNLSDYDKMALLAFLDALTDTTYYSNPAFQNPFQ
ncbi:MAG: cytochrome C peroxidase [Saprospiraceae bacterium]|nr:cytochrome C peroxidase [Saprospiraceae bacterium]MCF8248537.1 cytochrome C peroxidase [Saprospiraceae bacterium]MCF8310271.1 cytochrome C peroxidase [Saprospiraceae bacterium]MCF8439290.1 cytochrome C peroxidase [Saprospiraceae bacterium]